MEILLKVMIVRGNLNIILPSFSVQSLLRSNYYQEDVGVIEGKVIYCRGPSTERMLRNLSVMYQMSEINPSLSVCPRKQ